MFSPVPENTIMEQQGDSGPRVKLFPFPILFTFQWGGKKKKDCILKNSNEGTRETTPFLCSIFTLEGVEKS